MMHIGIAILFFAVGICTMKVKKDFLQKVEETENKEVIRRRRVKHEVCAFKERGTRYFIRKFENEDIEFWAINSEGEFFLGDWTEEEGLNRSDDFRELDWQIQRATERLRSYMLGNDFRLRGNWQ